MRRIRVTQIAAAMAALSVIGCSGSDASPTGGADSTNGESPSQTAQAASHPQVLIERTVSTLGADRLAAGVTPPTNRWYSSLAFGDPGLPVYPRPLSLRPQDGGFTMGLTTPVASADAIVAAANDELGVKFEGASGFGLVSAADSVGAELTIGPAVIAVAQGWPAVAVTASEHLTATLTLPFESTDAGIAVTDVGGRRYGIAVEDGRVDGTTLRLPAGASATFFAVPEGIDAETFGTALGASAPTPAVAWEVTDDAARTTVSYGDSPTVVVMPEARALGTTLSCDLGRFATIDGPFVACAAAEATWDVPLVEASAALDLSALSSEQRAAIEEALEEDVAATPWTLPEDTYFGGKALFRIANLLTIADALERGDIADELAVRLSNELRRWADVTGCNERPSACFLYDPTARGVVGLTPSFGAENFNDHYFHFGYLLYAAAVAGARDPGLLDEIGPVFDLVADDIASPAPTSLFPEWRHFDPVAGHSWASGTAPFADGNNQESSSEAVAAWNAVALWRDLRGEAYEGGAAQWMLSAEADAAQRIYLAPDLSGFAEYTHPTVGIQWSSKRDFATWFSAEPSAIVGIQLIPMPPAVSGLFASVDAARIEALIEAAWAGGTPAQFGDYLLMAQSTVPGQAGAAWEAARELSPSAIDDGNSRSYMLAWIASHQ